MASRCRVMSVLVTEDLAATQGIKEGKAEIEKSYRFHHHSQICSAEKSFFKHYIKSRSPSWILNSNSDKCLLPCATPLFKAFNRGESIRETTKNHQSTSNHINYCYTYIVLSQPPLENKRRRSQTWSINL
jgi:hypothetical protein